MSDVTALLAEAAWLTRLARSLVGNDDADDIVQEIRNAISTHAIGSSISLTVQRGNATLMLAITL